MTVKHQSSLVLEGGGSRGVFTAGVLDYLMEKEVKFPYVVGVSAGSCNALDYVSWQPGRTRDCMIIEDKANSYIATKEALKKHELFDMDMLFDKYPNELFPFDFDTYFSNDMNEIGEGQLWHINFPLSPCADMTPDIRAPLLEQKNASK